MAKIYGLFGSMTGKLADTVMAVRNGEQLARKYQPVVFNPSTPAQVAVRARMKMMSQLSEVLANGIGFSRKGNVSARNRFVSANFGKSTFDTADSEAKITLTEVDLTGGAIGIPSIMLTRSTGSVMVELSDSVNFDAIVYIAIQRGGDGKLRFFGIQQVTTPGSNNTFPSESFTIASSATGVVYAYGIRFNNDVAKARYQSLLAESTNGYLEVIRNASETDFSLTETVAAPFAAANA